MASIEEKIKALQEKLKQEKAKKQKMEARKKQAEVKIQRATDTRKKILLGAFVMALHEKNGIHAGQFTYESESFASWLTRDDDRALFGLSVLPKAPDGN